MRRALRALTRSVAWLGGLVFLLGGIAAITTLWAGDHDGLAPLTSALAAAGLLANRVSVHVLHTLK